MFQNRHRHPQSRSQSHSPAQLPLQNNNNADEPSSGADHVNIKVHTQVADNAAPASSQQPQPQQQEQATEPHPFIGYLESLVEDIRDYDPMDEDSVDLELSLADFCRALQSIPKGKAFTKSQFQQILTHLEMQHHALDVILGILQQHPQHHSINVHKWALAASIWFLFTSDRRATRAVSMGAIQGVVAIMRKYRTRHHGRCHHSDGGGSDDANTDACADSSNSNSNINNDSVSQENKKKTKHGTEMLQCAALSVLVQLLGNADATILKEVIASEVLGAVVHQPQNDGRSIKNPDENKNRNKNHCKNKSTTGLQCARSSCDTPVVFLLEEVVVAMEMHPGSLRIYKQACALFHGVCMLLQCDLDQSFTSSSSSSSSSNATTVTHDFQATAPTRQTKRRKIMESSSSSPPMAMQSAWRSLKRRLVNRIYQDGLLNHGIWDAEAKRISEATLRLVLDGTMARSVVCRAESQFFHGGAA